MELEPDIPNRRKPALVRSKTFDHSLLSQIQPDTEPKLERKKSQYSLLSKTNSQYHKLFKEISKDEVLRQTNTCALQKDILYQGRLFVSDSWICFHSKVFGKDTKIAIPVESVTQIKKTKTAILVPNALIIATKNERYLFVSLLTRDTTYKLLMSLCPHLEEKSPCSSPIPSSLENSFRAERSPCCPLSFSGEFSDLDGPMRPRGQVMEESSSSDSQTPDYDKMSEFPTLPAPYLEVLKQGEIPLETRQDPQHQQQQNPPHVTETKQQDTHYTGSPKCLKETCDNRALRPVSLNTLLFAYLFLVCVLVLSSCYMAFKIISLEQRLATLGSMTEFSHHQNEYLRGHSEASDEIYSELTLNLMKLEKVQRNLQRLLQDAD
ncbi:GRAM domain-containing protein 2B [Aplochiton taeniatus]